jgi:hypothetical protein
VLAAWSQFWNAIWGGHRDQSFSSRAYEARLLGKRWGRIAVAIIDRLFFFDPGHCRRAYASDDERSYRR